MIEKYLQWDELHQYNVQMQRMISVLQKYFAQYKIMWMQSADIVQWLDRLSATLDILQCMYIYNTDDLVALSSSGLPSRRHFDLLQLTVNNLRNSECVDISKQKTQFIDEIFRNRQINNVMLSDIAKTRGQQMCFDREIISPFQFTYLQERQCPHDSRKAFVCTWERIVNDSVLTKYVMLFEIDSQANDDFDEIMERLQSAVRLETRLILQLDKHARHIDIVDAYIYPKWIGRLIVGPVWMGNFTDDDNVIQKIISKNTNREDNCALQIIYEHTFSDHEVSINNVHDERGMKISHIQSFASSSIHEYKERGVVHSEEHIFAPHYVIRQLDVINRKLLHAIEEI